MWRIPVLLCLLVFPGAAAEVSSADTNARATKEREFKAYLMRAGPDALGNYIRQRTRLAALRNEVAAREAAGRNTMCSHQMVVDAAWLAGYVMDPARLEKRLDDLEQVLAHPEQEAKGGRQDPQDGSWGACHEEWFFRVNATYDHLTTPSNQGAVPRYRLRLFDRVNSPEKLQAYFDQISISDLSGTGVDHRRELNESLANLMRLILRHQPSYYAWDPKLPAVIMELILGPLRNPATGWWGERYVRNGQVEFVDDLSITFHVVSYLSGEVPGMPRIMEHLLAVKDLSYSIGWREEGRYSNHNNMDVVTLFRFGWSAMSDAQRQQSAAEIQKMLDWCLRDSLRPDGSFIPDEGTSDSAEESDNWGISFLDRIGYFDPAKRFWTRQKFPQADQIRARVLSYVEKHVATGGAGGAYYQKDLELLKTAGPAR